MMRMRLTVSAKSSTSSSPPPTATAAAAAAAASSGFRLTDNQTRYVRALRNHEKALVIVTGPAGSGKTKLAVEVGMEHLRHKSMQRVVLTRPLVPAGGEDMGYLPGNLYSKMQPWMAPIMDSVVDSPFNASIASQLSSIQQTGPSYQQQATSQVEVVPLAFMRGRTFSHSWIICDEAQNCTEQQLVMLLTRLGQGSKMVLTADPAQSDLCAAQRAPGHAAAAEAAVATLAAAVERSPNAFLRARVEHVRLDACDVKRHELIPHLIELFGQAS